jgi:hypothetical protein
MEPISDMVSVIVGLKGALDALDAPEENSSLLAKGELATDLEHAD